MERKLVTKKDAAIIAVLTVITLISLALGSYFKPRGALAVISVDGKTVKQISLCEINEKTDFALENGIVISAENGKIYFEKSDCKNKYCIGTGELSKAGDIAVCVPNKTVITITGTPENADVITY